MTAHNQFPEAGFMERGAKFQSASTREALVAAALMAAMAFAGSAGAQNAAFHNAPASAKSTKNPSGRSPEAATAGAAIYQQKCASCHGQKGQGMANIPALTKGPTQTVTDGELFWFITTGDVPDGMPAWESLPEKQRWDIVTYLKTINTAKAAAGGAAPGGGASANASAGNGQGNVIANTPMPTPPFLDFRTESPGTFHKITVTDLPAPFATKSANNGPRVVARPSDAWPKVPDGFKVEQYIATGIEEPRNIVTAPNGDYFFAESGPGNVKIARGITGDGKPELVATYATGLNRPYGIAFYPPGPDPKWVYVGNTNEVVRFAYKNGDLKATGGPEHIADVPGGGGHWTRPIVFTPDGKKMFVPVGSVSNVDDPDTTPAELNRADVLEFNPDGSGMRIYAYGIRNGGGGAAIDPKTGELWVSVNERDGLGDNLVPDYITHVEPGGFYGWPWWYMGGHQDPRRLGTHPELQDKVITPDVILQPHFASLGITFYDGKQFPAEYTGDIFAAEHGSWNKNIRGGYELIRVPLHGTGKATGEFEDFMTGFVLPDGNVWGRPVGVTVAADGSLLVTDDGSNAIWRITYTGAKSGD
jgi:glucose/arabinose dehydrogenase/mono/diheme cytochrome c family protein